MQSERERKREREEERKKERKKKRKRERERERGREREGDRERKKERKIYIYKQYLDPALELRSRIKVKNKPVGLLEHQRGDVELHDVLA